MIRVYLCNFRKCLYSPYNTFIEVIVSQTLHGPIWVSLLGFLAYVPHRLLHKFAYIALGFTCVHRVGSLAYSDSADSLDIVSVSVHLYCLRWHTI